MFAGNAAGELLPPYVIYRAGHMWTTWTENGPKGCRYNCSSSGWFDAAIFAEWLEWHMILYSFFIFFKLFTIAWRKVLSDWKNTNEGIRNTNIKKQAGWRIRGVCVQKRTISRANYLFR